MMLLNIIGYSTILLFTTCDFVGSQEQNKDTNHLLGSAAIDDDMGDVSTHVLTYYCDRPQSCAKVYEHVKNAQWNNSRKRYYVFPQFRVDINSLKEESVAIFNKHYVSFQVQMYDQCYLKNVATFLSTVVNFQVATYQVAPYSMHQVKLGWSQAPDPGSGITLPEKPISQTAETPWISLKIFAKDGDISKTLIKTLKSPENLNPVPPVPHIFDHNFKFPK